MGGTIDRLMQGGGATGIQEDSLPLTPPAKNPIDSVMTQGPSIDQIMGGTASNIRPTVTGQVDLGALPPEEPGLFGKILEMLKSQGKDMVQLGKYVLTQPGFNPTVPITGGLALKDIQLSAQGDPDATERLKRGMRGAAFVGSTVVAGGAGAFTGSLAKAAGGGLLKKAAAYLSAEALGGATYGAITPLDEGITREQEIRNDAISFPIAGAVLHGIFKGFGRIFKGLRGVDPEVAQQLNQMTEKEVADVGKRTEVILKGLGNIPPQAEEQVQSAALAQAVNERWMATEPGANLAPKRPRIYGDQAQLTGSKGRPPTATARVVDQPTGPTEPDFGVVTDTPIKRDLGIVSEDALQKEMADIAPRPAAPVDEEAAARARVEAARTTPFPGTESSIRSQLDAVFRNAAQKAAKDAGIKMPDIAIKAFQTGDNQQIEAAYLKLAKGNKVRAYKMLSEARKTLADAGVDIPSGITGEPLEETMARAADNPGPISEAAVKDAVTDRVVAETPPIDLMDDATKARAEQANAEAAGPPPPVDQRPPLTNTNAPPFDPAAGPEIREGWGGLKDEDLGKIEDAQRGFWESDAGAVSKAAAVRMAGVALSGASFWAADQEDDPQARRMLNYVGGILAIASLMPNSATRKWLQDTKWTYNIVKAVDAARVFSDGTLKGARDYQEIVQGATMKAVRLAERLAPVFKTDPNKVHASFAFDEGRGAPEWNLLTPDQQKEVASLGTVISTLGRQLTANGLVKDIRADFVAHLFRDKETRLLWTKQWEDIAKINPAAAKSFATLRSAEAWAKAFNKEAPLMDPTKSMPAYLSRANKMLANDGLRKAYERAGLLQDYNPTNILIQGAGYAAPRDVLRQVKIPNLGVTKMAPDEVATILERAAYAGSESEFVRSLDKAKSYLMRSIMVWPWEHGINVLRGAVALDGTGSMYREWMKRVAAADPQLKEISRHANLFQRPDFGFEGQTKFDKMLHQIGQQIGQASPTLKNLGIWAEDKRAIAERRLWDQKVPALGAAVWSKEMDAWAKRTGGKFGIGSAEYEAAARRAGDMANSAMGKVPDLMTSPRIQQALRLAMFSPNWTRGRIALSMGAMGEFQKIATGEISPKEASYLGYKLRSVLAAMVVTSTLSLALTGQMPEFNPNTLKYYAKTGVKDKNGREIGIDLAGWWQDDVKLLNDPIAFYRDRQNPMIREAQTQISGRDIFGRSIATNAERLESLLQMTGPPGEAASLVASSIGHAMRGEVSEAVSPANMIRDLSNMAAVGNVSVLPKESDALVNKYAAKLLRQSGLPDDKDRVFELSQFMKRNYAQGGSGFGGEVETYIAMQQRQYQKHDVAWLWQQGKRTLQNLTR